MQLSRISSRQNPRIKDALKLRDAKWRRRLGQCLVDGIREVGRALDAGVAVKQAFVSERAAGESHFAELMSRLRSTCEELFLVAPGVYSKLGYGERDDGLVVVAQPELVSLEGLSLSQRPLLAVVEAIEKPGNLGAILRTADGAGVEALVVADGGADIFHPNVIRASMGTVFRRNVARASVNDILPWLAERAISIYAARPDAKLAYDDADLTGPAALVLGSEAEGLSAHWDRRDVTPISLPMLGLADSLNVSATAAVLFYEALRQRKAV
jgi:TrmH family RNA methyltransferase